MPADYALSLDHLVVATRFDLASARQVCTELGFTVGPMGYHALGSVNHLILFEGSYLELIGVPRDGKQRQEVLQAPPGIDALVFGTDDADALHAVLVRAGMPVQAVQALAREVEREGLTREAKFRVVRALPGSFEAGRVYYCQQLTPELVWLPEYRQHANQAQAQTGLTLVADQPRREAEHYAKWAMSEVHTAPRNGFRVDAGAFWIEVISPAEYAARYGDFCCASLGRASFFGAIHMSTADLGAVQACVSKPSPLFQARRQADTLEVLIPKFNTLLVFSAQT